MVQYSKNGKIDMQKVTKTINSEYTFARQCHGTHQSPNWSVFIELTSYNTILYTALVITAT